MSKKAKKTGININELPIRDKNLNQDDIVNIFGGCKNEGDNCSKASECCGTLSYDGPMGHKLKCKQLNYPH
jgi:hypothetical protein